MARYFLHYHDGVDVTLDPDGSEFADIDAVRVEVLNAARNFIAQGAQAGCIDLAARIDVEDSSGQQVLSVRFAEAIELRR